LTARDHPYINVKDDFLTQIPQVSGWTGRYMGRGIVRYNYGTNTSIAQTGSNVATTFMITSRLHKLVSAWMVVVTSGGSVDNTGPNTLSITHQNYAATLNETIWANANTAKGSFQAIFDQSTDAGDSAYEFLIAQYILNTNCPNTDVVYATFEVYFPDWRDFELPA
jgi:hypothetical protein